MLCFCCLFFCVIICDGAFAGRLIPSGIFADKVPFVLGAGIFDAGQADAMIECTVFDMGNFTVNDNVGEGLTFSEYFAFNGGNT